MKTLILTIDQQGQSEWSIKAKNRQFGDWLEANQSIMPCDNLIILSAPGDTRIYWLEGDQESIVDIKTLEQIKDKIKPVLEVAFGLKLKPVDMVDPFKEEINKLNEARNNFSKN